MNLRQGSLVAMLCLFFWGASLAHAEQITVHERKTMLTDAQNQEAAINIAHLALTKRCEQAAHALQNVQPSQQEAVRYLTIKLISDLSPGYTSDLAVFIESQRSIPSTQRIVELGDGFQSSSPAFEYQSIAQNLFDRWALNQQLLAFCQAIETEQLELKQWLTAGGDTAVAMQREQLLAGNVANLSREGVDYLAGQITGNPIISWLPTKPVLVELAKASQHSELYTILWKMRPDNATLLELERLGELGDEFAIQQLIRASENPSLNQRSLQLLARLALHSEPAEAFMMSQARQRQNTGAMMRSAQQAIQETWLENLERQYPDWLPSLGVTDSN